MARNNSFFRTPLMSPAPAERPPIGPSTWPWHAVLLADVSESVRLNQLLGSDYPRRWAALLSALRQEVLGRSGAQWIKSTGDGFLAVFERPSDAAAFALHAQRRTAHDNADRVLEHWIQLRIGLHAGPLLFAEFDVFGPTPDLAQRLCTLASGGEVIVSQEFRDHLLPGIDGDVEDLGDCFLRHIEQPVRCYRLGVPVERRPMPTVQQQRNASLKAVIAVLPFELRTGFDPNGTLGVALSEEIILQLSRSAELTVISPRSTQQFQHRGIEPAQAGLHLAADLMLSGGYHQRADGFVLNVQLYDVRRSSVLWAEQYESTVTAAFDLGDPLAHRVALDCGRAIFRHVVTLTARAPLLAVESYALLFSAIGLMHRATAREFDRARDLLLHLVERQGRASIAEAWMAKWHVLRVVQGWSPDQAHESRLALVHVKRALDLDPNNALALAIGGLVHGYLLRDLDTAGRMYETALDDNPNEPLAWLFSATRHAYIGEGNDAEKAAAMALRLSPLDPLRYFFESLAASAVAGNSNWVRSEQLARSSIKANRTHASTWRTLTYVLVMQEREDEARQAASELLRMEPGLTVARFMGRFPGANGPMGEPWARALRVAGVPD